MAVPAVTPHDLDRVVEVLGRRREALVPHAPIFWRLAPDSDACHRAYLVHLLSEAGGARGWRSSTSVLIAAPQGPGWLVDDLAVDAKEGATDGHDLWNAFAAACAGEEIRLVCPTYEAQRAKLAVAAGLVVSESWWLRELDDSGGARKSACAGVRGGGSEPSGWSRGRLSGVVRRWVPTSLRLLHGHGARDLSCRQGPQVARHRPHPAPSHDCPQATR